jgi:hypothetical protein
MRQIREAIEFGNLAKFSSEVQDALRSGSRVTRCTDIGWPSENRTENPAAGNARVK